MIEQTAVPPPLPADNVRPKSNWRWLRITVGTIAAGSLAIGLLGSYNSPHLELVRRDLFDAAHDGRVLEITNTGKKLLKVVSFKINDRPDCNVSRLPLMGGELVFPLTLKIGDELSLMSSCH